MTKQLTCKEHLDAAEDKIRKAYLEAPRGERERLWSALMNIHRAQYILTGHEEFVKFCK